jgi:thiamine-monophosphate kinase
MTARHDALGPGREFDVIRSLIERWGVAAVGIGDDAALVRVPRGETLLASVDASVENVHFRRDWLAPEEIGYRAVTAALSDLAAMAARPLGMLLSLTLPESWMTELGRLADGIGAAAARYQSPILGGNLASALELTVTTTVLGAAFAPLTRSAARPGDLVYVTGELGGPAAALARFQRNEPAGDARSRLARPEARLNEARCLAEWGATAAIDISDGLVADLRHVAAASNVHIEVDAAAVPLFRSASIADALQGGDEYELALTSPAVLDVAAFARRFGIPLTEIGRVVSGSPTVDVVGEGARVADAKGYDHFSR